MKRIVKHTDAISRRAARVPREELEEFPVAPVSEPGSYAPPGEEAETEDSLSPEELRELVLAEAREEAARKVEEAYQEGYNRGVAAGREAFKESVAHAAEMLESAANAMRQAREDFLQSLEPQVVELATLIAERVIEREARTDPELVHATAARALARIADRQRLRLRVHPGDLEALQTHQVTLLEEFSGIETLDIEGDDEVTPGGCVAESELMQVDARLSTLLNNVLDTMMGQA